MKKILKKLIDEPIIDINILQNRFVFNKNDLTDIYELLKAATFNIESNNNIFIFPRTWELSHDNSFFNLTGPVLDIISIKNKLNQIIKPITISRTNDNLMLKFLENAGLITVFYTTGYNVNNLPECLKFSILDEFELLFNQSYFNKSIFFKHNSYINFSKEILV